MRVRVVEREERAVDIEQGDPLAMDVDQSRLTGLDFVSARRTVACERVRPDPAA